MDFTEQISPMNVRDAARIAAKPIGTRDPMVAPEDIVGDCIVFMLEMGQLTPQQVRAA